MWLESIHEVWKHLDWNQEVWQQISWYITQDTLPKLAEDSLQKTFVYPLFGKDEQNQPIFSEKQRREIVRNWFNTFFGNHKAFRFMKEMAGETWRDDLLDIYKRQIELVGQENIVLLVWSQDSVSPADSLKPYRKNKVWENIRVIEIDAWHVPYMEKPKETAALTKWIFTTSEW